jgi:hypothetical protein
VVYIPEYVVGHWWEQLLHNQSALRLKSRLLFTPGVVVASVPWQLESSVAQDATGKPAPKAPELSAAAPPATHTGPAARAGVGDGPPPSSSGGDTHGAP